MACFSDTVYNCTLSQNFRVKIELPIMCPQAACLYKTDCNAVQRA